MLLLDTFVGEAKFWGGYEPPSFYPGSCTGEGPYAALPVGPSLGSRTHV